MYTGPVILKNILPSEEYTHFLKLHLGIRILCNKNLIAINENVLFAQHLLDSFVAEGNLLYDNFVVYNVHGLLHITEYVENFGTLDQYSAFNFENYMKTLKNFLKKNL